MSLDISKVLGESLERAFSRNGLILMAGVYLATLIGMIGFSSAMVDSLDSFWQELVAENPEFADLFDGPEELLPLALDLPSSVSLLLVLTSIVASVVLLAVAIRVFHADLRDELPAEIVFDNLAWVAVNLFVGGIIFGIFWILGLILLIIPGIVIFVFLIYYLAAIAVEDRNFIDGFARSVSVTRGQRIKVFLLFLAVFVISFAVGITFGLVGAFAHFVEPVLGELIELIAQTILTVYFAAVVAVSYQQLTAPDQSAETKADAEEDFFEEFTPASQSTQW